jgi:hypothetical protein
MGFVGAAAFRSGTLQAPIAFDVVSNGGEMDLALGLGEPEPSHATKMIAALPSAEDFLDPGANGPQRTIVRFEPCGGQPAMALAHELRSSALGFDGLFDRQRIIGFVGVNLAGLFRDDRRSDSNIGLIGRRRLNRADDSRVLVCSNMRL